MLLTRLGIAERIVDTAPRRGLLPDLPKRLLEFGPPGWKDEMRG